MKHPMLLVAFCGLLPLLPAQIVRVANESNAPFRGYVKTTVDVMPPYNSGFIDREDGREVSYLLGRQCGLDTRRLDVRIDLRPGERVMLDLGKSKPSKVTAAPLPKDPIGWWGWPWTIGGTQLEFVSLDPDGAGLLAHLRARTGRMLCNDLWLQWNADEPWARGELVVTASNPQVEDLVAAVPERFVLKFGSAITLVPGHQPDDPVLQAGTLIGDGQALVLPVTLLVPKQITQKDQWVSIAALDKVAAVGISRLLVHGNPRSPPGFDALVWANARYDRAVSELGGFAWPMLGGSPYSRITGAQEDQIFVRGEPLRENGAFAAVITQLGVYRQGCRPLHHLEASGAQLDYTAHKDLVLWDGRPHFTGSDHLGKPRSLSEAESYYWSGPDVQHWLINSIAAATRYTGSPACQWLLSAHARIYPFQWRVPGWRWEARAIGYEGMNAVHMHRELEDRKLAEAVKVHWLARADLVIVPYVLGNPIEWVRDDRIGPGLRTAPWQLCLEAFGLDLAGEYFQHEGARKAALLVASLMMQQAWWHDGNRWTCRNVLAQDGAWVPSGGYDWFGSPLAPYVIARQANIAPPKLVEQAKEIIEQLLQEASSPANFGWMPPIK
jgi:hypothetical protein